MRMILQLEPYPTRLTCRRGGKPPDGLDLAYEVVDDGHDQADDDHDNEPDVDRPPIPRRHGNDAHGSAL